MNIRSKEKGGELSQFLPHSSPVYESREEEPPSSSSSSSPAARWDYTMNQDNSKVTMPKLLNSTDDDDDDDNHNHDDGARWVDAASGTGGHNIWSSSADIPLNSAYFRGGGHDADSLYTASTFNSDPSQAFASRQGLHVSSNEWHPSDITRSMAQLNMGSGEQRHFHPGGLVSVPSMASASGSGATIPGVVGASSGSTSGISNRSTSTWSDQASLRQHQRFPEPHSHQSPFAASQPFSSDSLGFSRAPPGFGQQTHASINETDSVSFDSRIQKSAGGAGRRNNSQKKGQPHWKSNKPRNNNNYNSRGGRGRGSGPSYRDDRSKSPTPTTGDDFTTASSKASSEAIRMLMTAPTSSSTASITSSQASALTGSRLLLDQFASEKSQVQAGRPILPAIEDAFMPPYDDEEDDDDDEEGEESSEIWGDGIGPHSPSSKKREWLLRMNRRMSETPIGLLYPTSIPVSAIMNAWAKTKSAQGASMVEMWLKRIQEEFDVGNSKAVPNTKMYTMAGKFTTDDLLCNYEYIC